MTLRVDLCQGFVKIGEQVDGTFDGNIRKDATGLFTLTTAITDDSRDLINEVDSILVWDDRTPSERIVFPGIVAPSSDVTSPGIRREVTPSGEYATISGIHVRGILRGRLAWPDPTTEPPWAVSHDVRTGYGAEVAAAFIDANLGISAHPDRQVPGVETITGPFGEVSTWSARLETVDELTARICRESGILCRVRMSVPGEVQFVFGTATDRSATVRFDVDADATQFQALTSAATGTWVLGAGAGELTDRAFRVATSGAAGIGRIEVLYENTNITSDGNLSLAVSNELLERAANRSADLTISASSASRYRFLDDYDLGDVVAIEDGDQRYLAVVEAVRMSSTALTSEITPVLGSAATGQTQQLIRDVEGLSARLNRQVS